MGLLDNLKNLAGRKNSPQKISVESSVPLKKILVVEDDDAIRQLYVEILNSEGFETIEAVNGQIGLEMVQSQRPSLVLLDLMMPVMDGKSMLHRVREIPEFKTLPVIVLTNAGDVENMKETKLYDNADEFLIKSNVKPQEIIDKIKIYI